ncbi:MAG: hypothetical protein LBR37_02085 [Erysipelotrichaceae bacterium]|jgi:hypothetical protein|nr:hypothetical protein [Erysipelotrichaceae bacterium]
MFKKDQELFTILNTNIGAMRYIRFSQAFLMQFGAGYLNIEYKDAEGQIRPTFILPNGIKIYSISMSPKQAKQVAKIINRDFLSS